MGKRPRIADIAPHTVMVLF